MKKTPLLTLAILFASVLASVSSEAHHSRSLFFSDDEGVTTIEGVISNVRWVNPHLTFIIDVPREDGGVDEWEIVSMPASFLHRRGWSAQTLSAGQRIVFTGWKGRSTTRLQAWLREMIVYDETLARLYIEFTDAAVKRKVAALGLPGCPPITSDCVTLDAEALHQLQQEVGDELPLLFGRAEELVALR